MKKLLKIEYVHEIDENPDTSFLGEFTDRAHEWAIIRKSGEFVAKVEQRIRIIETLQEWIDYGEDLSAEAIAMYENRIKKIENSGDCELPSAGREYRYFLPYDCGEKQGTALYKEYGKQDWKRMERFGDTWQYIGISAVATIKCDCCENEYEISSGGLWGIESDSDEEFKKEIEKEQLAELREMLLDSGIEGCELITEIERVEK